MVTDAFLAHALDVAKRAAAAGEAVIAKYYRRDVPVEIKADETPVTRADRETEQAILAVLRPAFPDNLPRIAVHQQRITVNGLYRHGFLIAPALAELTLNYVERGQIDNEVMRCV